MQITSTNPTNFEYKVVSIRDLRVNMVTDPEAKKPRVDTIEVDGEPLEPTQRMFTSLFSRYGFNSAFFKYYDHEEVFTRIAEREANDRIRLCIERQTLNTGAVRSSMLAVSNPTKPIVPFEEVQTMLDQYGGHTATYHNGIVESIHTPARGTGGFDIAGDEFFNRFMLGTPVDGYGSPSIWLSMLRTVCSNGLVAFAKMFRQDVALGKGSDDVTLAMRRALEQFNDEEGFAALRSMFELAAQSWASVGECQKLYKLLVGLHNKEQFADLGGAVPVQAKDTYKYLAQNAGTLEDLQEGKVMSPVIKAYHGLTGDLQQIYGITNMEALSEKRRKALPAKCSVMHLFNFVTEVATHYAEADGSRKLQGFLGDMLGSEYDMAGTMKQFPDFAHFHVDRKLVTGSTGRTTVA